jgi:hypothetical protein
MRKLRHAIFGDKLSNELSFGISLRYGNPLEKDGKTIQGHF